MNLNRKFTAFTKILFLLKDVIYLFLESREGTEREKEDKHQ